MRRGRALFRVGNPCNGNVCLLRASNMLSSTRQRESTRSTTGSSHGRNKRTLCRTVYLALARTPRQSRIRDEKQSNRCCFSSLIRIAEGLAIEMLIDIYCLRRAVMLLVMLVADCLLSQKSSTLIGQLGYKGTDASKKDAQTLSQPRSARGRSLGFRG